jgi:hypothetical protein
MDNVQLLNQTSNTRGATRRSKSTVAMFATEQREASGKLHIVSQPGVYNTAYMGSEVDLVDLKSIQSPGVVPRGAPHLAAR